MPMATKMYIASDGNASENRNRTAATTPARLKASAMLLMTIIAMPVTTMGSMTIVCRNDWSSFRARLVMKYTQETGTTAMIEPMIAKNSLIGPLGARIVRSARE